MNEIAEIKDIESKIYNIRGVEVMLDSDLAKQYQCANGTKSINLAVKRNIERFPSDFYFQLNEEEFNKICGFNLKLQNNKIRSLPYVFTEQGVAMLATVIRTDVAAKVSIDIMRAFVKMRNYIKYNDQLLPHKYLLLEEKVDNNTKRIDELFDRFNPKDIIKNKIFFEGEFYDAYSLLINILNEAKKEIIIIDNYAGKELLDILKDINRKIIIISKNIDVMLKKKYESQYSNVIFINNSSFHDRFIIVDRVKLYSCGASFKDLGKKCFSVSEFKDKECLIMILKNINFK